MKTLCGASQSAKLETTNCNTPPPFPRVSKLITSKTEKSTKKRRATPSLHKDLSEIFPSDGIDISHDENIFPRSFLQRKNIPEIFPTTKIPFQDNSYDNDLVEIFPRSFSYELSFGDRFPRSRFRFCVLPLFRSKSARNLAPGGVMLDILRVKRYDVHPNAPHNMCRVLLPCALL